jgi:hypothetical protein
MSEPWSFAQYLLVGGAVLLAIGLGLWWVLPVPMTFPPFLLTALLALGYGGYEWRRDRRGGGRP